MGLASRVVPTGSARAAAEELAAELARLPQGCLRSDRQSTLLQLDEPLPVAAALEREFRLGLATLLGADGIKGAAAFSAGAFRHGGQR